MLYIITSYSTQQVVISRKYNEKSQLYIYLPLINYFMENLLNINLHLSLEKNISYYT